MISGSRAHRFYAFLTGSILSLGLSSVAGADAQWTVSYSSAFESRRTARDYREFTDARSGLIEQGEFADPSIERSPCDHNLWPRCLSRVIDHEATKRRVPQRPPGRASFACVLWLWRSIASGRLSSSGAVSTGSLANPGVFPTDVFTRGSYRTKRPIAVGNATRL